MSLAVYDLIISVGSEVLIFSTLSVLIIHLTGSLSVHACRACLIKDRANLNQNGWGITVIFYNFNPELRSQSLMIRAYNHKLRKEKHVSQMCMMMINSMISIIRMIDRKSTT